LAKRSPLGTVVFDKPYFILVEAKKERKKERKKAPLMKDGGSVWQK
jgi:hypothetical protein